ncbi:hypothetical protein B0H14DRAFT_3591271 [Mycena olivaceomarginata]|nr:hypothetical protein B0H14DRAFT_3591271 [Mycena olivaceomarginata]
MRHSPAAGQKHCECRQTDIAAKGLCFREYVQGARYRLPAQVPDGRSEADSAMGRPMQAKATQAKEEREQDPPRDWRGSSRIPFVFTRTLVLSTPDLPRSFFLPHRARITIPLPPSAAAYLRVCRPSFHVASPTFLSSFFLSSARTTVSCVHFRPPRRTLVTGSFPGAPLPPSAPSRRCHPTPSPSRYMPCQLVSPRTSALWGDFPLRATSSSGKKGEDCGNSGKDRGRRWVRRAKRGRSLPGAEPAHVEETEGKGGIACARPQCTRPTCVAADAAVTAGHVLAAFEGCWACGEAEEGRTKPPGRTPSNVRKGPIR